MANVVEYILNLKNNMSPGITNATEHVKQLEGHLSSVKTIIGGLGAPIGAAFAVFQGWQFVKEGVDKFKQLEEVTAKVEANLVSTKEVAGVSLSDIQGYAGKLAGHINSSKTEVMDMASQMLTFPSITKDTFESSMGLIADIAKQTGHELSDTAIMYGKALSDPTDGLQKMMRYGVMFSDAEKEKITQLQESGKLVAAQKFMMEAIARSGYAGVAEAMFNADPVARFNKMIGSAKTAVGELAMDILKKIMPTLEVIGAGLKKTVGFIKEHITLVKMIITTYAIYKGIMLGILAVEKMIVMWKGISATATQILIGWELARAEGMGVVTAAQWALNAAMNANPIGLIVAGIAALIAGVIALTKHFGSFGHMVKQVWEIVKAFVVGAGKAMWGLGETITGALTFNPKLISKGMHDTVSSVKTAVKEIKDAWNNVETKKGLVPKKTVGATGAVGKTGAAGATAAAPKTKAEGQKNINIHIAYNAALIDKFTISTTNIKEGMGSLKDKVSEILVGATHDALMVADY